MDSTPSDFELGLALLAALDGPGPHSRETIAAWTGISKERIAQIEDRALKKLRRLLRKAGVSDSDVAAFLAATDRESDFKPWTK